MKVFTSLDRYLQQGGAGTARGPVALIFAEDAVDLAGTVQHHLRAGFKTVLLCLDDGVAPPDMSEGSPEARADASGAPTKAHVAAIRVSDTRADAMARTVTRIQASVPPGTWIYWGYNTEYLFFPFCETRSVAEMLAFHAEERRRAMVGFTVDIYSADPSPDRVPQAEALIDKAGYYALARSGPDGPLERQLDFFGGLRWRFEEHVPRHRRRIDRVALFRAAPDMQLRPDGTLSEPEMNTYQCPWHHNLTCTVISFRTAKALMLNPGSRHAIGSFCWHNSTPFQWSSAQLMDLGLMEPGQWF